MNYFRVGIPLLTGLNEMLNVNQERKYIEPLLVSKRHYSTFYIAADFYGRKKDHVSLCSWYVNQYVGNADAKGRRKRLTFGSYFCYSCL